MTRTGSWVVRIDGQDFTLQGIVQPFLDVSYHGDYPAASTIKPLDTSAGDVATALGLAGATFSKAVMDEIDETCAGPLEPLKELLKTLPARVTDLAINQSSGVFLFGFCCDLSGKGLAPYGVPLAAFGLSLRYVVQPARPPIAASRRGSVNRTPPRGRRR